MLHDEIHFSDHENSLAQQSEATKKKSSSVEIVLHGCTKQSD